MSRDERLAKNEVLFRSVNERVREISNDEWSVTESVEFLCECVQTDCLERIAISIATYERVRSDPTHFIVLPGHERLDIESVVEANETYVVVEKHESTKPFVVENDPRA